jgi:hypothetical protein
MLRDLRLFIYLVIKFIRADGNVFRTNTNVISAAGVAKFRTVFGLTETSSCSDIR